jgi:hypothetical protein
MLAAINLDDEPSIVANEIDDVGTYEGLAPKACSAKAMRTQMIPKSLFCIAHCAAKAAC